MTKTNIMIGVGLLIVIGLVGGGALVFSNRNQSKEPEAGVLLTREGVVQVSDGTVQGRYKPYSDGNLATNKDGKTVLFFYANWCPTCIPADQDLIANLGSLGDIDVIRVNYNDSETSSEERELARKYGVTYQHTFVQIDEAGNELKKWNGGGSQEILANVVE